MSQRKSAVVLLSGGLDSTVVATMALGPYDSSDVLAVSFAYGQKHTVEIEQAALIAEHLELGGHMVVEVPKVFGGAGSTLIVGGSENPQMSYSELHENEGPLPTVVPFRNANLLSLATTIAITHGAETVYYGAHAEDAHNWAYPDCTPEFNGAMANAIFVGSYQQVRLVVPLQWMTKSQVVDLGLRLDAPLHLTHSCYAGLRPACGLCPTCVERLQAFETLGVPDPIEYESRPD